MAVTLTDLVRDVRDELYGYVTVKDRMAYLASDLTDDAEVFQLVDDGSVRQLRIGMILQFGTDDALATELMRVRTVDSATRLVGVKRAVMGTTAAAWAADGTEIAIEPEYPTTAIVREINKTIVGLPPNIWSFKTLDTTVDGYRFGYEMPSTAIAVQSVQYQVPGPDEEWHQIRRYDFDRSQRLLNIIEVPFPGQPMRVIYRAYPTALAEGDDLADAGLGDEMRELIALGALYRLLMPRATGRVVDTRAESPINGEFRRPDPVNQAIRQIYAMFQERLGAERERQRLEWPVRMYYRF